MGPLGNRVRVYGRPVQSFDERGVVRAERVAPDRVVVGHHGRDGRGAVRDGAPRQLERGRGARASDVGEHRDPVPGGGARGAHNLRDLLVREQSRLAGRAAWHQRVDACVHELVDVRGQGALVEAAVLVERREQRHDHAWPAELHGSGVPESRGRHTSGTASPTRTARSRCTQASEARRPAASSQLS